MTRQLVRERAQFRCEYCHLHQDHEPSRPFHIEHIIARQHRGDDHLENLALAFHLCNWHKGPNLTSLDPDTNALTRLFHPRQDKWPDHFRLEGVRIVGLTDIGKTTLWLLEMNGEERLELRSILLDAGEIDPTSYA
ncbi:HNH endonuclease [Prosthecobacter debontii]|uniref:HNH endonuclease n=1 Tax=Prosthecobacter debontii TaxID=48467 RepID=A0A1T4YZB6_9BACT|nr:HNH endonuclease [Prosthecobacter debontii]SKB07139.1 HNH endonuclease [Prosthecobacter debontii]